MKNKLILTLAIALLVCYGVHDVQGNPDVQGLRNRFSLAIVIAFSVYLWEEFKVVPEAEKGED